MKIKYSLFCVLIIILSVVSYIIYLMLDYRNNFSKIQDIKSKGIYPELVEKYFFQYSKCPSKNEFTELLTMKKQNDCFYTYYIDFFAKRKKFINYFPIYKKKFIDPVSFVLISNGIDRKFNNQFLLNDSVSESEVFEKLNVYNHNIKNFRNIFLPDTINFNLFDYFWGEKDYLIHYFDFIEKFKVTSQFEFPKAITIDSLLSKISIKKSWPFISKIIQIKIDRSYLIKQQKDLIILAHDNFKIYFYLLPYKRKISFDDKKIIIGKFEELDINNQKIIMRNCFIE